MANSGWNYRTAYFEDFDGKYYKLTISTALNSNGITIYNIGTIKEEAHPKIMGSRAGNGDGPRGVASSADSIRSSTEDDKERFSTADDTEYMAAVESGDMEAAQKMVDEAAKKWGAITDESGTPLVLYHGTNDTFWTFDANEINPVEGSFFFAQNREDAEVYSGTGRVMEVFVKLQNPIDYNEMPAEIYKLRTKKGQVEALKSLGYDGWYADMDSGWGEISAFYSEQIKSAEAVTYDDDGNVIPLSERFDSGEQDIRYSVDDELSINLQLVLNGDFDAKSNEVHIGTTSNFLTKEIGAEALYLYMLAEKAYRAMVTEERAVFEGKPTVAGINYHGLGLEGLVDILNTSEKPIAAFADTPSKGNKRENRIVLVTDVKAQGGLGVVIEELDTFALKNSNRIKANKAITVYPKGNIQSAIQEAIADDRILYLDEKRSQTHLPIVKGANYPTVGRKADFANNIRRIWENAK